MGEYLLRKKTNLESPIFDFTWRIIIELCVSCHSLLFLNSPVARMQLSGVWSQSMLASCDRQKNPADGWNQVVACTLQQSNIHWMWPPPSNSDQLDYCNFSRGFLWDSYKPSFTTVTGRGPHSKYTPPQYVAAHETFCGLQLAIPP